MGKGEQVTITLPNLEVSLCSVCIYLLYIWNIGVRAYISVLMILWVNLEMLIAYNSHKNAFVIIITRGYISRVQALQ